MKLQFRVRNPQTGAFLYYPEEPEALNLAHLDVDLYTGIKDKHGMEVYENDTIFVDHFHPSTYTVRFIEGGFCAWNEVMDDYFIDINMLTDSVGCHFAVVKK